MAQFGMWRWVRATDTITWSDEVYRIIGCDPALPPPGHEELLLRHTADSLARHRAAISRAAENRQPYEIDLEIADTDGGTKWITVRGEVESYLNGEVAQLRGTVEELSEKRYAEGALALSDNRCRSFVLASAAIPWMAHPDGSPPRELPAWQAFTGQTQEQIVGLGWADAIHPDDREKTLIEWTRAVASGQTYEVEHRLRRFDGVYRDMLVRGVPVHDKFGNLAEWVGLHIDVTEQRETERANLQSGQKLGTVLLSIADGMIVLDQSWRCSYVDEHGAHILGASAEDLFGACIWDISPLANGTQFRACCQNAVESGQPTHFAEFYPDPLNKWLEGHCFATAEGLLVYIQDITERMEDEAALRTRELLFRTIVESTSDAIVCKSSDGIITHWNRAAEEMFGYSAKETLGSNISMLLTLDRIGEEIGIQARIASGEKIVDFETVRIRKDGKRISVSATVSPLEDADGRIVGYSKFLRDIGDRTLMEEARTLANSVLEQRVAERTKALAEARDRAESADRLKSAFLATMSHELRTPLNSIIGFTGIMLQQLAGPVNPEQLKQLGMVRNSALHLLALINDVLDISKIEAGQFHLCPEPFDLRSSVDKSVATVRPLAEKKGVALRIEQLSPMEPLVSDRRRVEQVLINLLNNGIKFTDQGEVCVSIETVAECKLPGAEQPTACVRVRVADTGLGITPEQLPELFQPFRQLDYGLARRHEGTGLGLTICRRLLEVLGGTIDVESTIGVGSTFTFSIPLDCGVSV